MDEFNLKISHVSCIYYIYTYKTLTASELSEICNEDKASISRAVLFLEENGYLKYVENQTKRYRALLKLTQKGVEVGKKIVSNIKTCLDEASQNVSEEERMVMYKSLGTICKNLENFC